MSHYNLLGRESHVLECHVDVDLQAQLLLIIFKGSLELVVVFLVEFDDPFDAHIYQLRQRLFVGEGYETLSVFRLQRVGERYQLLGDDDAGVVGS